METTTAELKAKFMKELESKSDDELVKKYEKAESSEELDGLFNHFVTSALTTHFIN